MYKHIAISGFRGIRQLELPALGRINILTGLNGSCKTSVLEALSLHAHPLDLNQLLQLNNVRIGSAVNIASQPVTKDDTPWRSLFYGYATGKDPIVISGQLESRAWTLTYVNQDSALPEAVLPVQPAQQQGPTSPPIATLRVECKEQDLRWYQTVSIALNGALSASQVVGSGAIPDARAARVVTNARNLPNLAAQFSRLSQLGHDGIITDILKCVDPRVRRVSVWTNGAFSSLSVDVGRQYALDISLVSDGLTRTAAMALAVSQATKGICCIDEFENGIHYSVLPSVWKGVIAACHRFDTQLFVTTHSLECIRAALAAATLEDNLVINRLELTEDGNVIAAPFTKEDAEAALVAGLEVR